MSLCIYENYCIDIINRYTHLEIHFRGYKKSCPQIVTEVRELLRKVIKKSSENLKVEKDKNFIFAFKCPNKITCIVQEKGKAKDKASTQCTECFPQCYVLDLENDDSYRCWFSDQMSSPGAKTSVDGPPTKRYRIQTNELLGISDLVDILDLLKKHGYSSVSYYDLGLHLGLLSTTLDVIEANNKDVRAALRKCLTAWLQQVDNVKSKGVPTYDTLIQTLRKMGENAVADGIERELSKE
uniref:Death domain-containing protein n=1 Tax=Amphimedon queenslandica TaxID=400682 RepID=A0A1X7SMS5_AMPQE